ncbi:ECF transporter S component [Brassicibacter mesophilus]|uniref:ECF transporter S component n=1 Tax=Brassicibacter mesophilus TaxID=745119 RepID=UPI003D20DF40
MKANESIVRKGSITRITYCGMLIALSAVGSLIKIQGTIAFDSMPGFFAALFLGPAAGALVAGLGHILTAVTSGFPLTVPMHIIVALEMALFGYLFGWIYIKSNGILASIAAIILNGPVAALIAVPTSIMLGLPFNGWALFSVVILPLTIASAANVILAYVVHKVLNKRMR